MGFIKDAFTGKPDNYHAQMPYRRYAAQIDTGEDQAEAANNQQTDINGQQAELAKALAAQANGAGPSLAQTQLQGALQQNLAGTQSAISSVKGMNPALAARQILQQQAGERQQMAGQSAELRLREQMAARDELARALAAQRQGANAQQTANTSFFGTAGGLENQATLGTNQINAGVAATNAAANTALTGGLINAAGSVLAHGGSSGGAAGAAGAAPASMFAPAHGGVIPGKPTVPGDDQANDTVPAMLSPGEIVIPRSVAQSPDADQRAAEFVAAIKKAGPGGVAASVPAQGYGKVLAVQRQIQEQMARLESLMKRKA